jgi:hypothetical protein
MCTEMNVNDPRYKEYLDSESALALFFNSKMEVDNHKDELNEAFINTSTDKEVDLSFQDIPVKVPESSLQYEPSVAQPEHASILVLERQRSQGHRFHTTSKVTMLERYDGTKIKHVQKGTFVDLTSRKSRKRLGENEENIAPKQSAEGLRKKANILEGTLNILSDKNSDVASTILSKQIDKRGPEFAKELLQKSKALSET